MISTLKEKGLISVSKEKIDNRGGKVLAFTELGKEVAKELGLN
jgi:DNA-binding PadR family transcriptional regulator